MIPNSYKKELQQHSCRVTRLYLYWYVVKHVNPVYSRKCYDMKIHVQCTQGCMSCMSCKTITQVKGYGDNNNNIDVYGIIGITVLILLL